MQMDVQKNKSGLIKQKKQKEKDFSTFVLVSHKIQARTISP